MPISAEAPWLNYYGAIPRTLNYPRLTIYQLVAQTARECPDLPAYEFMGRRTSYRDFLARIDRAALALYTAGIRAGDRVTICMPNTPQALDCFYALNRIGAVSNMIHPLSAEEEIRFYLDVSGSQAILTLDRFYGKVAAAAARAKRKPKLWIARLQPELKPAPQQTPAPVPPAPAAPAPRKAEPPRQAGPLEPFAFWPAVLADLEENDAMLISFLRGTRAYCDGKRVLFECSDAFRDYIRNNREVSKRLKETIYRVSRTKYSIGPYEEPKTDDNTAAVSLDETLHTMQALGVDLKIVDK